VEDAIIKIKDIKLCGMHCRCKLGHSSSSRRMGDLSEAYYRCGRANPMKVILEEISWGS
jgi:hypothetical protein